MRFNLTVNPGTDLINFIPSQFANSSKYSINCGALIDVGTPACITGLTSLCISFCKPGNNSITFSITASSLIRGSADLNLRQGCSGTMSVSGLQAASVNWTSIFPGAQGAYNSYLSCTGCTSTTVTPQTGSPAYIDYRVYGTGNCTGTRSDTIRVYTSPALTVSIAPVAPAICSGASATLTATPTGGSGPYTYSWAPGSGATTNSSFVVSTVGTYTVTVRDTISGCPAVSQPVTVTAAATPAAPTAAGTTVCSGNTATLTATAPGGTYQWFAAASGGTALSTGATYTTPVLTTTTTYYVETTVGGCPSPRTAVTVSVTPKPAAPTAAGTAICAGNTASLTATAPGGTYEWYTAASGGTLLATNATYTTPVLNTATTYYVQTTVNSCISNTRTAVTVSVNPTPIAPTAAGTTICSGNTASLTATAPGGTYRWYDAAANGNLLATGATYSTPVLTATTTYYVDASSAAGCTGTRTAVTVNVTPFNNPAFNYSSGTYCVTGTNPTPAIAGSASGTFSASPAGLVFISTATGQINLSASALNTYTITFVTSGTCVYTSSASLTITNAPNASFAYSGPYCQKQTNPLPVFPTGASAGLFTASPAGLSFISTSTGEIDLNNSAPGTYTLTNNIAPAGGCAAATATNTVTINPVATVTAGNNQTVCATIPVTLAGAIGGSASSATWSGGTGSFSNAALLNAVYTPAAGETSVKLYLTSNDPAGPCGAVKDSLILTIIPTPAAPTAAATTICAGNTASLTATAPGGTYQWFAAASGGTALATATTYTTPVLTANTTYYVQTTVNSCAGPRTAVVVTVTPIPAAPTAAANTICSGNTSSLTATAPGGTYQWYDAASGGNLLATTANYTTPVLNTATTYYVQTTLNNCTGPRSAVSIAVNPTPAAPVASGSSICSGNATSLTATAPGGTYRWYDAAANGNLLATGATYSTPVLTATTTYYVDASSAAGCTGTRTAVTVNVTPFNNPAFNYSSGTYCVTGTNPTPAIAGSASGTFSASPAGLVFISTATGQINLSASALNTYTITFVTSGSCVYTSSANVTITNAPNASFAYSGPYCQKQTNPLPVFPSGASAGLFTASPAGLSFISTSTGEIDLNNSAPGTYTLTNNIAAAGGCASSIFTNAVTINPMATVNAGSDQTVCATIPVTLAGAIGGSASSATWSGGTGSFSNAALLNAVYTPAAGETSVKLYLTSNDPAGPCGAVKDSLILTIIPTPAAPTAAAATICAGNTASLTATAPGGTYQWFAAASGGSVLTNNPAYTSPVLTNTTTYYVQATINNCAGPRTPVTATVMPTPAAPTITANTICSGNATSITATAPGGTYQWYDAFANGTLLVTNASLTTSVLNTTTTYYVQATINGCAGPRTAATVTVNPTPALPAINSNSPVCVGSTLNLTTPSVTGATYSWSGPNGFVSSLQNPIITGVIPASAGIYSVTITANNCTSNPGILNINPVIAAPKAGSNSPVCEGSILQLSASNIPGATYGWTGPNGFTSSVPNPTNGSSLANAGAYVVTAFIAGCPGLSDTTLVEINPIPTAPAISSNSPLCAGDIITLSASNLKGATYQWTGPGGFLSSVQNPVISNAGMSNGGTYKVSVTTAGCSATANSSIKVIVNPVPATPIAGNNGPLCEGEALTLFVTNIANATYSWSGPAGFSSPLQNPLLSNITVANADTFRVVANVNGCSSKPAITKPVINQPSVTNAGNDQTVCANNAVVALSGTVAGGGSTAIWNSSGTGSFFPANTSLAATYVASNSDTAAGNVIISLRSTNNGACPATVSSFVVNITDAPTVNPGADQNICSNSPNAALNGVVTNATGGIWSSSGAGRFYPSNTDLTAIYTPGSGDVSKGTVAILLTTTGNGGCKPVADSKIITIMQAPLVNAGPDRLMLENGTIRLEPVVSGSNLQYEWLPDLYLNNNRIKNPLVTGKNSQLYTLKVTGSGSCVTEDQVFVKVLKPIIVPNIFSPNGDGINDVWNIDQLINYPDATVEIYTRTGQKIYTSVGYTRPWDGTYNNKPVPVATYYYIINPKITGSLLSGSVTVIR